VPSEHNLQAFKPSNLQTRVVVKLGGEIMLNAAGLDALAADIVALAGRGVEVVVVHGGGPQADELARRMGHTVRKVAGRRVTDDDALEVAKMVYGGSTNLELLAALKRHGGRGVGLSGVDADLVTVTRRPPTKVVDPVTGSEELVDFGHVGDVTDVDISVLKTLLDAGCVPVVASLAADREGRIYNVNADTIATALAAGLGASSLFLVTNVPGILRDPSDPASVLRTCTSAEIARLIESGAISGGMLPKVHNALEALRAGVERVHIIDGTRARSPLLDSFTRQSEGTTISKNYEL
jgi:acetylglutamate kinase